MQYPEENFLLLLLHLPLALSILYRCSNSRLNAPFFWMNHQALWTPWCSIYGKYGCIWNGFCSVSCGSLAHIYNRSCLHGNVLVWRWETVLCFELRKGPLLEFELQQGLRSLFPYRVLFLYANWFCLDSCIWGKLFFSDGAENSCRIFWDMINGIYDSANNWLHSHQNGLFLNTMDIFRIFCWCLCLRGVRRMHFHMLQQFCWCKGALLLILLQILASGRLLFP